MSLDFYALVFRSIAEETASPLKIIFPAGEVPQQTGLLMKRGISMNEQARYDYSYTENRELSWLKFNIRVLEEADCPQTPAFERLKFISIFTSNLDEFYMVRVGSLFDLAQAGDLDPDNKSGLTCAQQLEEIYKETPELYRKRNRSYQNVAKALEEYHICRPQFDRLTPNERKYIDKYFKRSILPLLSPQVVDNMHPFPHLNNKQPYIAAVLRHGKDECYGLIPVSPALGRIIALPESDLRFVLLEDVILEYAELVFEQYNITEKTVICVTRNADIDTDEGLYDADIDFRQHMKKILKKRARLAPVRLEATSPLSKGLQGFLCERLSLKGEQVFVSKAPLNMSYVFALEDMLPASVKQLLLNQPFRPQDTPDLHARQSVLRQVLKKDVVLSYPFESMKPFLALIKEAANDPAVLSIKITLYRISRESKLAESLIAAAENGKEITVLMELRARFDEQNNIEWAQRLEEAGCNVIYGFDGYKVHSKICLITRKDRSRIQYITQIGTGNYNEKTSRLYTDLSLITADPDICADAVSFFKNVAIANLEGSYKKLWVAPYSLKSNVIKRIEGEIEKAKLGKPAAILMKMNSLTDRDVIDKLSEASQCGVPVQLIIRGICCLIPGVPGKTDHISVISIVGRFLEHSRVYCFGVGSEMELYIASADMMTRNTQRRVEIACPVENPRLRERIYKMLQIMLEDTVKGRRLHPDGQYRFRNREPFAEASQERFMKLAAERSHSAVPNQAPRDSFTRRIKRLFHQK